MLRSFWAASNDRDPPERIERLPFVSVEEGWISYNVEGKARFQERLTGDLLERDDRLYAGVQDVEREFDRSGCARP